MATVEKATVKSGNTKTDLTQKKARNFLLTLNDVSVYEFLADNLKAYKTLGYLLAYKEKAPSTGHEHIHIYVHFTNAIKLSAKKVLGAHIDICRGTPQQVIKYVSKDGDLVEEYGEKPKQGGKNIKEIREMKKEDRELLPINYFNIVEKINQEENADIDIEDLAKNIKVYYIQGKPGVGKTEKMKAIVRENKNIYGTKINMLKFDNNFWLGLGSAKIAVYDDFRDSHMKASEFINFIDYNKHYMNVKGGTKLNNYELIIITSIQKLNEIYKHMPEEGKNQWMRRVELIDMYNEKTEEEEEENDLDIDEL